MVVGWSGGGRAVTTTWHRGGGGDGNGDVALVMVSGAPRGVCARVREGG